MMVNARDQGGDNADHVLAFYIMSRVIDLFLNSKEGKAWTQRKVDQLNREGSIPVREGLRSAGASWKARETPPKKRSRTVSMNAPEQSSGCGCVLLLALGLVVTAATLVLAYG